MANVVTLGASGNAATLDASGNTATLADTRDDVTASAWTWDNAALTFDSDQWTFDGST